MSNIACMNHMYYGEKNKIKEIIASTGYILLNNALNTEAYTELSKIVKKLKFTANVVPDMHSYSVSRPERSVLDMMAEIKDYVSNVTSQNLRIKRITIRKYSAGDYLLQHDEKTESGINVILFLLDKWKPDYRGEYTYVLDQPLFFYPENNTLAIIKRGENIRRFVKKISHHAGKNSFVAIEVVLEQ